MIPLHRINHGERERELVLAAMAAGDMAGNGRFTRLAQELLRDLSGAAHVLLTSSCTHALEMAALLLDIGPGDEVICPSFTFMSTANAFVLRGAEIVFVDIDPHTLCLDPLAVRSAITPRTRAIVTVHYAGASADMDLLMAIANEHRLWVVEDAAHAVQSRWRGRSLGSIGHLGAFSFHASKCLTSGGEGGALLVNDPALLERAEILREKGTDRERYLRGEIPRYQWLDVGSSYLMSELQAAFLCAQLQRAEDLRDLRCSIWASYQAAFVALEEAGQVWRPDYPEGLSHNAAGYFLRTGNGARRDALQAFCHARGVAVAAHYAPLHAAPAGIRFGRFHGEDVCTTHAASALLRLPLWAGMTPDEVGQVIAAITGFFAEI